MSDERDAAGQFTLSTDGLIGAEYENAKAGFTTRKDEPAEQDEPEGDPVREASAKLASRRREAENLSVVEIMQAATDRDPKEARTAEQAGAEYASARSEVARFAERIDLSSLAQKVDEDRAAAVDGDKDRAKHFGFDLEDKPEAKAEPKDETPKEDQVDAATAAAIDAVEGLDENTKRALKIPQVRAAIEQQLGEVESARQQFRALAQQFAQASLLEGFPELAGLPPQHLEAGLQLLAQQNPQRFQQALSILNRVQALQASAQQSQQLQAQEQRQQFEASVMTEDTRLAEMFGGDKAAAEAANAATISYLAEHGIPRHQMVQTFMANPVLSTAEARRTIWEASEYRRMKEAPKAVPKGLPPVQRPGIQRDVPRASDNSSKIQSLQKQLANANGDKAARIAGQIRSLKRAQ